MDHGLPGSSVHGILQARILERVAIPFSRGSSRSLSCFLHWQVNSLPLAPPGKPMRKHIYLQMCAVPLFFPGSSQHSPHLTTHGRTFSSRIMSGPMPHITFHSVKTQISSGEPSLSSVS